MFLFGNNFFIYVVRKNGQIKSFHWDFSASLPVTAAISAGRCIAATLLRHQLGRSAIHARAKGAA
jgi:hypothetical protein